MSFQVTIWNYTQMALALETSHTLIDFLARVLNTSHMWLVTTGSYLLQGEQALECHQEATGRPAQRAVGLHLQELEELLPYLVHD